MVKSIKYYTYRAIQKNGKGYVFSANDIHLKYPRYAIERSLVDLEKEGKIARALPGLYYYPEYNNILKCFAGPNIDAVAKALAKKHNWTIFPEGNTALNYLGLSTQVPARYVYISDGLAREYKIGNTILKFLHRVPKQTGVKGKNANLVVQSLKSLGKTSAEQEEFIYKLSKCFTKKEWELIEKATTKIAQWMQSIIKKAKEITDETTH